MPSKALVSGKSGFSFSSVFSTHNSRYSVAVFVWLILLLAAWPARAATTWTVNTLSDDATTSNTVAQTNCQSGNSDTCALRDAILSAGSGDTINFSVTGTITLSSGLPEMLQSLTITGPGASQLTISGNNAYQVFFVQLYSTVSISGLTIANGSVSCTGSGCNAFAGAIENAGTLTVTNTVFNNNNVSCAGSECIAMGGAIYNTIGVLHVINSVFSGNTATCTQTNCETEGGAIANADTGTLTVTGSAFNGNFSLYGGAIDNGNNCSYATTATVTNSTFSGNTAWLAGAILNWYTLTVTESTIAGNVTSGGTYYAAGGHYGGGIDNNCSAGSMTLANTIVSGNTTVPYENAGPSIVDDIIKYSYTDNGGNIIGYANGATVDSASANLLALGNYGGPTETMLPQPGSPAICAGLSANLPGGVTTDQRGWPLASNCPSGNVDSGAVQTNYALVNTLADTTNGIDSTSCTDGTESSSNTCSLRDLLAQTQTSSTAITDADFAPSLFVSGAPPAPTPGTITLGSGMHAIDGTLNLVGPGANLLTVSGGSTHATPFGVNTGATFSLYGLTLTNGYSGIQNNGTATVADCTITGASESGIFNGATLAVNNCTFSGNYAPAGGGAGIFNFVDSTATVTNSTVSGNNANGAYGGGIYNNYGGTMTVSNSTVSGNTATYGGAISNDGTMTLTNSTVAGNTAFSVGGIMGYGTVTLNNSIVAGNAPTDISVSGTLNDSAPNQIGLPGGVTSVNQILGTMASSPAAATVQTMMPLPGATSLLCAGSAALLPSGVTTDERSFPMDPQCTSGAIDLGAAQTNYTGYTTTGYNGVVYQTISPSPTAEVLETNALTGAQDSVGGIPVTLTLVGNGTLNGTATEPTATTTVNNVTSNLAVYSGLSINVAGTGDTFTPSIGAYTPTANVTAGTFNIDAALGTQLVFTTPPATPLQEGNAEPVVVTEETAGGATLTNASDTITLTVINSSSNVVYSTSQAASSGVASFSVPAGTLPAAGTYTFTASVTGTNSITPASQQVAFTSLTLPSATLAGGTFGASYSAGINAATNGVGTVTYALASGSQLPAGLSLTAATGAISGTPAAVGTFTFSIQATDSLDYTATQSYSITIGAATPTVNGISPTTATAGAVAFPLTVNGANFTAASTVMWGTTSLGTGYVSASELQVTVPAALVATEGTASVTVVTPAPGGGTSGGSTFTVSALAPTVSGISPMNITAGSATFPLTVSGANFTAASTVMWGTTALTTTFVSSTEVTVQVAAALVAEGGTATVTVVSPAPGGGTSGAETFTINGAPLPAVSGISPALAVAGAAAFPLTVTGTNFTNASVVMWGSTALTTTYVSPTELTAQVTAAEVAAAGTLPVTVVTPAPGGGTSNAYVFEVDTAGSTAPTFATTSVTVTAGGAGTYGVTLPSTATDVYVTCLNLPAGATCGYSGGVLTINTAATTPTGTYVITAVFSETLPGAASAVVLLPFLLLPFAGAKRRRKLGMMVAGLVVLAVAVVASGGCGGGGGGGGYTPPAPTTHTVSSSGAVTLVVH
jgi:hypothetical protein